MPVIVDPDQVLPDKTKNVRPSQLMLWLLFPVILAVGFVVGLVVGIKQGENTVIANTANVNKKTATIIPNANARVNTSTVNTNTQVDTNTQVVTNTTNANINTNVSTNTNNAFVNISNTSMGGGDYLKLSADMQTALEAQQQKDLDSLVDNTASVTDIVRQRDLIATKYALKSYASVMGNYPTTGGQATKIEGKAGEVLYAALKQFYGGSYNLKIDPQSPDYYYGYTSDGTTFTLTAYLVSKKKAFTLTDGA